MKKGQNFRAKPHFLELTERKKNPPELFPYMNDVKNIIKYYIIRIDAENFCQKADQLIILI